MRTLYPPIEPFAVELMDVGGGHTIYVEHCGREDGLPVVFLHGGPGGGCKADHRQFFDPARYHVVLLDQRGAGRSRPFGGVESNTTQDLIADLEQIREASGFERWLLFGGSWGAALALAYAEAHPDRVSGLVLRGTFLARQADFEWFCERGASALLPDAWERFLEAVQGNQENDLLALLHRLTFSSDEADEERVTRAWEAWSGAVVMYSFNSVPGGGAGELKDAIVKMRLEMHYAYNRYFIRENQLLEEAGRLPDVPIRIIHGQRDITCTAAAAWALHRAVPHSEIELLRTAGHLSGEPQMIDALVRAADDFAEKLSAPR